VADATEDVRNLSALPAAGTGARVYGGINEWVHHPADDRGVDYGPLENITVSIQSAGLWRDVVTDRNGEYELQGAPVRPVSISVATPSGSSRTDRRRADATSTPPTEHAAYRGIAI